MALLRPVTPLPQWQHGCFGLYVLFRPGGPGLGLTSPLFMSNKTIVVNGEMLYYEFSLLLESLQSLHTERFALWLRLSNVWIIDKTMSLLASR